MASFAKEFALLASLVLAVPVAAQVRPAFSDTGFEAEAYGAAEHYPMPPPDRPFDQSTVIAWHSHYDHIAGKVDTVAKGSTPSALKYGSAEIAPTKIADYLTHNPVTSFAVARDDTILSEHYLYARTDKDRFLSNSMAKSITGLLVGIALSDGAIHALDDTAQTYVPELAGTEYGATPIRDLLHMASGVQFSETYRPGSDILKLQAGLLWPGAVGGPGALKPFNTRVASPGTRFSYSSADTEVLGLVVSHATHSTLAAYASTHLWQKLGAEQDAGWAADPKGNDVAYCCYVATLRDWLRLGLMLAHDGAWNGQQVVPRQYLLDGTTVSKGDDYLRRGEAGYGYQTWLLPGGGRTFALAGRFGQWVFVDPASRLVMAQTAVEMKTGEDAPTSVTYDLWRKLLTHTE